jgi:hypothetical protein
VHLSLLLALGDEEGVDEDGGEEVQEEGVAIGGHH